MKRNISNPRYVVSQSTVTKTSPLKTPARVRKPLPADSAPRATRFERVLVPVDFSDTSRKALEAALPFARQFGASLTLLHVIEPVVYPVDYLVVPPEMEDATIALGREAKNRLAAMKVDASQANGVEIDSITRTGRPYQEIIEAAKSLRADLIVIGTHGYTGLKKIYLGSTAERVMRHAPCPVLVVRDLDYGKRGKR
jgi:universal stress protein A